MFFEEFAQLRHGGLETLIVFISELSFWRWELPKNDGKLKHVNYVSLQLPEDCF